MRHLNHKQSGVVIVVALFIIAIVAAMSYAMLARVSRDTIRTTMILRNIKAEALAEGSLMWALDEIGTPENNAPKQFVVSPEELAKSEVDGYNVQSKIIDMQARFNLNSLREKWAADIFKSLLVKVDPKLKAEQIEAISDATIKWISEDTDEKLEEYYLKLPNPYRPAHRKMINPSELKLVKGVTPELYKALKPFITALPTATTINVQTAPPEVLMALHLQLNQNIATAILGLRKQKPFKKKEEFLYCEIIPKGMRESLTKSIDVQSNYFLIETTVAIETQHLALYSLVERTNKEDSKVKILWQSKGLWQ